jgi:hypothetical protein
VWRNRHDAPAWPVLDLCRCVHGTARDFTGVAGTSINHVGVYGQLEDDIFVPSVLHAGVLGAAGTQPGVIGFSADNDGVQGQSFNGGGVMGNSSFGSGVSGRSLASSGVRSQGGASFEVRELAGGKSSVAFSYRIVGRRKDINRHKRFAKIDQRLALPPVRGRRPAPTLRAFIAEIEKETRAKATPAMRKRDREVAAMPPPEDVPF